jgi:hypothetical protein
MAYEGGSSSTIRIKSASVPIGTPLEAVTFYDGPINAPGTDDGGQSGGQVYSSPIHSGYNVRVWAKAVDTAGILADSFPVYQDFFH